MTARQNKFLGGTGSCAIIVCAAVFAAFFYHQEACRDFSEWSMAQKKGEVVFSDCSEVIKSCSGKHDYTVFHNPEFVAWTPDKWKSLSVLQKIEKGVVYSEYHSDDSTLGVAAVSEYYKDDEVAEVHIRLECLVQNDEYSGGWGLRLSDPTKVVFRVPSKERMCVFSGCALNEKKDGFTFDVSRGSSTATVKCIRKPDGHYDISILGGSSRVLSKNTTLVTIDSSATRPTTTGVR